MGARLARMPGEKLACPHRPASFGLDPLVLSKTFAEARACRKQKIRVNTFMIAKDPYLVEFVENFSRICGGKAFYTGLDALGEFVFVDYAGNRRQRLR